MFVICYFFFFQAEDGIRDGRVTGVQTCALPIWLRRAERDKQRIPGVVLDVDRDSLCVERVMNGRVRCRIGRANHHGAAHIALLLTPAWLSAMRRAPPLARWHPREIGRAHV